MRSRVITARLRERAVVTLKTGAAFGGVLYSHDDKALVLKEAQALGAGDRATDVSLDGEMMFLISNVDYVQFP